MDNHRSLLKNKLQGSHNLVLSRKGNEGVGDCVLPCVEGFLLIHQLQQSISIIASPFKSVHKYVRF